MSEERDEEKRERQKITVREKGRVERRKRYRE